jgi:hypothetical protein
MSPTMGVRRALLEAGESPDVRGQQRPGRVARFEACGWIKIRDMYRTWEQMSCPTPVIRRPIDKLSGLGAICPV